MTAQLCACSGRHSPRLTPATVVTHHSPPRSWPLAPGAQRVTHELCPTAHYLAHGLLNAYVEAGGLPRRSVLRQYPALIQEIAYESWTAADRSQPLRRTVAFPSP